MYLTESLLEQMRSQLINQALSAGSFTDEKVVRLSQELDKFIVEYQKANLPPSYYYYKATSTG
ncbi:aspartyl-phosphate phosphatase Spo0E family protein [Paenibacillus piri]|uniref:Aspartyl-phosphate phosphatase Spo0E family protein n=1 Tax=Paenibacillus piri TaxID=2547395 RepID=A0A4R5KL50_9BACL|nr:aspartyl-phosphate phosphatase Spo0E family protein [Paenibacillus piri]TDF96301.1 aspartyl-phosphate phosphatase Spo0E family protein [Paenibacillus piri]